MCLPGTRTIHIEEIYAWAAQLDGEANIGSGAQILLVPGPAGSGKSALAHTVCRKVDGQGLLVCSTFFDHMGDQVTAADFMAVLI